MYYIVEEDCRAVVKSFFFKGKEEKELERSSWEIRENYLDFLSIHMISMKTELFTCISNISSLL